MDFYVCSIFLLGFTRYLELNLRRTWDSSWRGHSTPFSIDTRSWTVSVLISLDPPFHLCCRDWCVPRMEDPGCWSNASRDEMDPVFQLCRNDDWHGVLECISRKPWLATSPMIMDNHIATTILHQAITSKGSTDLRAKVIRRILNTTPQAAAIKNGYGSLPLHVIAQRNTKMDAPTKEKLIFDLVGAYKGALTEEGGVGKRTPLHIIFTGTWICLGDRGECCITSCRMKGSS